MNERIKYAFRNNFILEVTKIGYIDRMYLFLKEDDEAFFMCNAEEIFTYLKIRKD